MAGKLFVISAPSGTGKTTLVDALLLGWQQESSYPLKRVITYTTRTPRPGEVDGVDYHFVTVSDFKAKQEAGFFIETTEFCGNWYGSPSFILNPAIRGQDSFIFVIDQEGAHALKGVPGVVFIWIMPPSIEELIVRLQKRSKDFDASLDKRVQKAQQELEREQQDRMYDYHLVNDDFSRTLSELKALVGAEIEKKVGVGN